jgi:hypothetical protein
MIMVAGFELHVSMTVILPFAPPHGLHMKPRRRTLSHDIKHGGVNLVAREREIIKYAFGEKICSAETKTML